MIKEITGSWAFSLWVLNVGLLPRREAMPGLMLFMDKEHRKGQLILVFPLKHCYAKCRS